MKGHYSSITFLIITIFLFSVLSAPATVQVTGQIDQVSSSINLQNQLRPDQTLVGAEGVLNSIPNYLINLKNETGSWALPSTNLDDTVYTGYAGGTAGMISYLLDYSNLETSLVSDESKTLALSIAIELGNYLDSIKMSNSTGNFWNISSSSTIIDPGFDFGLSGIAFSFAKLYNLTEISDFSILATNTMKAVDFLTNKTGGLHWESSLVDTVRSAKWYPDLTMNYFTNENYRLNNPPPSFTGRGLGTVGVAETSLKVIEWLDIDDKNALEYQLLNSSLEFLASQFNETGQELSINHTSPSIGLITTSKATGVSGIVDFLLDLHTFNGNATYLEWSTKMINWLNGTDSGINRFRSTVDVNGTLLLDDIIGYYHGIAGNLDTLRDYSNFVDTTAFDTRLSSLTFYVHNFGQDQNNYYKYPISRVKGSLNGIGAIGYTTAQSGILPLIDAMTKELGITSIDSDIDKAKSYLYSQVITDLNHSVISPVGSVDPEANPSTGFLSTYLALLVPIKGQLEVRTSTVDFGTRPVNSSFSSSIILENVGDESITASWTDLSDSDVFKTGNLSKIIPARSTFNLFISFIPQHENSYSTTLAITSGNGENFEVLLQGVAFDRPVLELTDVLSNNTVIDSRQNQEFTVTATDSSEIASVLFSINGTERQMTTTVGSDTYQATWDLSNIQNGTYIITITAEDSLGYSTSQTLVYTVGVYDPPIQERVFSDTTLFILGGITMVVIIAAVLITRRITN